MIGVGGGEEFGEEFFGGFLLCGEVFVGGVGLVFRDAVAGDEGGESFSVDREPDACLVEFVVDFLEGGECFQGGEFWEDGG
ncbi:MAG: hypothetical protein ACJAQT_001383 [Akkermansiaceae bacterium]